MLHCTHFDMMTYLLIWKKNKKLFSSKWNKHWRILASWHYQIQKKNIFIIVDASASGVGAILVQADDKRQMHVITYNWRNFTESEQKIAVIYRELTAIVYAFEIYEILISCSKHLIAIFTDYKPILSLFAREVSMNTPFLRDQNVFTRFPNLIFWTEGQKLCLARLLGRSFSKMLLEYQKKLHETNPQKIDLHTAASKI